MIPMPTKIVVPSGLAMRFDAYDEWLATRGCAPKTLRKYGIVARQFVRWLIDNGRAVDPDELTMDDVRSFLRASQLQSSAATHHARFIGLRSFLTFLMREGLLDGVHGQRGRVPTIAADIDAPPRPTAPDVPIITPEEFGEMVELIMRPPRDFLSHRDEAIVRLFWDCGARLSEIALTVVEDYRLTKDGGTVYVTGKAAKRQGPRRRALDFSPITAVAVNRYLRERAKQPVADLPNMWIGRGGSAGGVTALADTGVSQMLYRRAESVVADFHPHMFRHSFAHRWLDNGGEEGDLMRIMGWTDRSMLDRYAKSLANERARKKLPKVMGW